MSTSSLHEGRKKRIARFIRRIHSFFHFYATRSLHRQFSVGKGFPLKYPGGGQGGEGYGLRGVRQASCVIYLTRYN
jgi:hypothetical protein